jgi:photosystem II stability/assembly factor-like uncharacterized protein
MKRVAIVLSIGLAVVACKGKGTPTGGGGGGGGWLVGKSGLMAEVNPDGNLGPGYQPTSTQDLNGIACRYLGEAWVVGNAGTLLYTNDGGTSWAPQAIPTSNALVAIATQDVGPVYVGGADGLFVTLDTGKTWTQAPTRVDAVAAAQKGDTVLALGGDQLYTYENGALGLRGTFAGARSVAVSEDGSIAMVVGNGAWRSTDAGTTWTQLAIDPSLTLNAVRVGVDGSAIAAGNNGAIVSIDATGTATVQNVGATNLMSMHIPDVEDPAQIGFAGGADGQVYVTRDSGATWAAGPNVGRAVFGIDQIGVGHL